MDWWHEDPELLKATLFLLAAAEEDPPRPHQPAAVATATASSFVDALRIDATTTATATSSTSNDDTESKPTTKTATATSRQRRVINVSRERRRDEARYLRSKVAELEAQLLILQHRRDQMLGAHLSESGEIRSVAVIWEVLATRQVRELRRSELLNAKLKGMLETQMRIAEDLLVAIRSAEEQSKKQRDDAEGLISLKWPRDRLAIDISQKVSEQDQLKRVDGLCLQWESAFARCPRFSDGSSIRFFDMKLLQDNGSEAVVDVFSSYAVPFPKEQVEEMKWQFFMEESTEEEGLWWAQHCEPRDDAIVSVFRVVTTIDTHRVKFDGKNVCKRLRCPQGNLLLVSHMYSEPQCVSKLLDDVALDEDAWFRIVESHSIGGPKLSCPLTVVQHVRRMYIRFGQRHLAADQAGTEEATRRVGALTEFLMVQVEDEVKRGEQMVENMLLDKFGQISIENREAYEVVL